MTQKKIYFPFTVSLETNNYLLNTFSKVFTF